MSDPFSNYMRAQERHMGWLQIKYLDKHGNVTAIKQYGDDPLADKADNPKHGYWQDPEDSKMLSTVEDGDGI